MRTAIQNKHNYLFTIKLEQTGSPMNIQKDLYKYLYVWANVEMVKKSGPTLGVEFKGPANTLHRLVRH